MDLFYHFHDSCLLINNTEAFGLAPSTASAGRGHRSVIRCADASNHQNALGKRFNDVLAMRINGSYYLCELHLQVKDSSLKSSL